MANLIKMETKRKVAIAYLQVAVFVEDDEPGTAADTISAIFTDNLQDSGLILDWGYLESSVPGHFAYPREIHDVDPDEYQEGDLVNKNIDEIPFYKS